MKFTFPPANRIVAFAGPYISLLSGAVASWLVVHVQVLGSLHLGQNEVSTDIAYGVTAVLGAGIPHLGMQKWLDGHQKFTSELFALIDGLPDASSVKGEIIGALPAVNGDVLAALKKVVEPERAGKTAVPVKQEQTAALDPGPSGDGSGDIEHPNSLVDTAAPALDPPPTGPLGNDALHAPVADPAPAAGAGGAQ